MAGGGQSSRSKASVRLSLRADRAFGLSAVCVKRGVRRQPVNTASASGLTASTASRATAPTIASPRLPQSPAVAFQSDAAPFRIDELFTAPLLPTEKKKIALATMNDNEVRGCVKCRLSNVRTRTVFGEGDVDAKLFFIGEGPGENEDQTGRPFVGRAGQLLDRMIVARGLSRAQVFIANIVKCRPPQNRMPALDEAAICTPYLVRQLEIVRPRVIVTLGLSSTRYMLQVNSTMGKLRGQWQAWRGIKLMPTFHPAYILRSYTAQTRAAVWSDLQQVMKELGLNPSVKSGNGLQ